MEDIGSVFVTVEADSEDLVPLAIPVMSAVVFVDLSVDDDVEFHTNIVP